MIGVGSNMISMEESIKAEDVTVLKLMITSEFRSEHYDHIKMYMNIWLGIRFRLNITKLIDEQLSKQKWKD